LREIKKRKSIISVYLCDFLYSQSQITHLKNGHFKNVHFGYSGRDF
jgi:hypothetical protein